MQLIRRVRESKTPCGINGSRWQTFVSLPGQQFGKPFQRLAGDHLIIGNGWRQIASGTGCRHNLKRGAGIQHVPLEDTAMVGGEREPDFVALDLALRELAAVDERKAQVVELRFFGGLSVDETAEVLKVSPITVMRDWSTARAWLYRELRPARSGE